MELRFWGVRGSTAVPGVTTLVVGGNTSCLSLQCRDYLFVFDAGTGIRRLGAYLEAADRTGIRGGIYFTHYHWDHIQGLPFFAPAFRRENRFDLYGERKNHQDIRALLGDQMHAPFFPVPLAAGSALASFNSLAPQETFEPLPGMTLSTIPLIHPNGCLGFRLAGPEGSFCLITDHEHPETGLDANVVEFARGASVLVHDAQYSPEEKRGPKSGWGHSSWEEAARTARAANVGRLFLTHHDPDRSDSEVFRMLAQAREIFSDTELATESVVCEIAAGAAGC